MMLNQKKPEAYISINKSRLKRFGSKVYLQDRANFEIELFNPTQFRYGVKFKLNGQYISDRHLILEPGQRQFLDRFIETKKKFEFSTYEIEDSAAAKAAVDKNGLVEVEFYAENFGNLFVYDMWSSPFTGSSGKFNDNSGGWTYTTLTNAIMDCYNVSGDVSVNYCAPVEQPKKNLLRSVTVKKAKSTVETGRVNQSQENSKQSFQSTTANFDTFSSHRVVIQLLPISHQPVKPKELVEYCTQCGMKYKKNWTFCPKCGTKRS